MEHMVPAGSQLGEDTKATNLVPAGSHGGLHKLAR